MQLKTLRVSPSSAQTDVEMNGSTSSSDAKNGDRDATRSPELKKQRIEAPKVEKDKKKDMRYKLLVPKASSWAITEAMGGEVRVPASEFT